MVASAAAIAAHADADLNSDSVLNSGWSSLSAVQKTAILNDIATKAEAAKTTSTDPVVSTTQTLDKVDKYVGIGERIGKMVGGAAKEVGMAVNDFAKTPVGIWAIVMITWTYMGGAVVHLLLGITLFVFSMTLIFYCLSKSRKVVREYYENKTTWYGAPLIKLETRSGFDSDDIQAAFIFGAIASVVSIIIVLTF